MKRDPKGYYSLFDFQVHLQYAPNNKICGLALGDDFSMGINAARFFTKKIHLGIFGSYQPRGLFGLVFNSGFTPKFGQDIARYANYTSLSHTDSVTAAYFVSQCSASNNLGGCGRYLYGISFGLPYKFFPMIRVYQGLEDVLVSNEGLPSTQEYEDWLNLTYAVRGVSLSFCYNMDDNGQRTGHNLTFGIFYEQVEFGSATLDGLPLKNFINPAFFNTYGTAYRFGIKVGWEFF